jgi:putative flippase GtrA
VTLPAAPGPPGAGADHRATLVQLIAFGAAGATAFVVEVTAFAFAYWLLPIVAVANGLAVALGSAVSYTLQARLVFKTTASVRRTVLRYLLALAVVYVVSTVLVALLLDRGATPALAKIAVSAALAPLAFAASRRWVYAA